MGDTTFRIIMIYWSLSWTFTCQVYISPW